MKKFAILAFLGILSFAVANAQHGFFFTRKSKVNFVSDAPLELIKASSEKLNGVIDPEKRTFAFSIPVESFKGFNSPLQQEHFYENYLETKTYPASTFEGKIIEEIDFSRDGNYTIRAKGRLNIHGIVQERIIKIQLRISKGVLYANTIFTVLLTDHNITIPRIVNQKIAKEIKVTVTTELTKK